MNTKNNYIVNIIIVSYKNPDITVNCVESIRKTTKYNYNIIIVDNASPDNTVAVLKNKLPGIEIIENNQNLGYSGAINVAASHSHAPFLLISNNDVIYRENVIDYLIDYMKKNEDIAVCGPGQEYADGSWQISSGDLPSVALAWKQLFFVENISNAFNKILKSIRVKSNSEKNVGYVDGAVMLVRKDVFEMLNGFDEDFDFYSEEADFCYRVAAKGYRVVSYTKLTVTHLRGGSNNFGHLNDDNIHKLIASKILFCKKHSTSKETKKYIRLEKLHSYIYSKLVKLFALFSFGKFRENLKNKSRILNSFYNAWSNELKKYNE